MADTPLNTLKPLDRLKPFRRIHNDGFRPTDDEKPDGLGVACGCHTPSAFPNLEKDFKEFLKKNTGVLGKIGELIDEIHQKAQDAAKILNTATTLLTAAAALLGTALGGPILALFLALKTAAAVAKTVAKIIDTITGAIDDFIHEFFARRAAKIAHRAIRVIPQWVPVKKGASSQAITSDQIREVEGIVTRSYGDPIEPPFFQWHRWLNWSFQVKPEDRYKNLLVEGFKPDPKAIDSGETPVIRDGTFEVQWDAGALFSSAARFETQFEEADMPANDGPMTSASDPDTATKARTTFWIWPMTGMYAWASGRWVYDCSRTDSLTSSNPKMCAMMTPPRAIATASWEAFQFVENLSSDAKKVNRVPAIRFMFLTARTGGYLNYGSIGDTDYEFIVDLPPIEAPTTPFPIGHTFAHKRDAPSELPDFPHNTIVIRPRLLRDLQPLNPDPGDGGLIKPILQVLPPPPDASGNAPPPGTPPKQVLVTVKGSDIAKIKSATGGFILSLGWLDPNRSQAATVQDCNVAFSGLTGRLSVNRDSPKQLFNDLFKNDLDKLKQTIKDKVDNISLDTPIPGVTLSINDLANFQSNTLPPAVVNAVRNIGQTLKNLVDKAVDDAVDNIINGITNGISKDEDEEWLLRAGVNGRWQTRFIKLKDNQPIALSNPYSFHIPLGPDDLLFYSSGGVEFNPVGAMMRAGHADRILKGKDDKGNDVELTWGQIAGASGDKLRDMMFDYTIKVLVGNSASGFALGIENTVLGIMDPGDFSSPGGNPATSNPLRMKGTLPGTTQIQPVVHFAQASDIDKECILEEDGRNDYKFIGLIQISKQNSDT